MSTNGKHCPGTKVHDPSLDFIPQCQLSDWSRIFRPCRFYWWSSYLSSWAIRFSLILPNSLCVFILPLTLRECLLVVLYDTMIALALILIDGAVAHLLKAAYIYLLGLYARTNSNCFLPPVLGKVPGELRERQRALSLCPTTRAH